MDKGPLKQGTKEQFSDDQRKHYECLIGASLRRARNKIGMSQEKLGDLVGLSYQQIQKYETGVNRMTILTGLMCAQAMDVPFYFLYKAASEQMVLDMKEIDP